MKAFQIIPALLTVVYGLAVPLVMVLDSHFPQSSNTNILGLMHVIQALNSAFFLGFAALLRGVGSTHARPLAIAAVLSGTLGILVQVMSAADQSEAMVIPRQAILGFSALSGGLNAAFFMILGVWLTRSQAPHLAGRRVLCGLSLTLALVAVFGILSALCGMLYPISPLILLQIAGYVNTVHLLASAAFFGIIAYRPEWPLVRPNI